MMIMIIVAWLIVYYDTLYNTLIHHLIVLLVVLPFTLLPILLLYIGDYNLFKLITKIILMNCSSVSQHRLLLCMQYTMLRFINNVHY